MKFRGKFKLSCILFLLSLWCFPTYASSAEITRNTMEALNSPSQWGSIQFSSGGGAIVASDSPQGGNSLRYKFPVGISDGQEPARVWYSANSNLSDVYVQFYHKYSSDFTWHPIANKILYLYSDGNRDAHGCFIVEYGDLRFDVYGTNNNLVQYNTNTGFPQKGKWYKYTLRVKMNTSPGAKNGILQVWIDDVLKINRSDVMYFASGTTVTGWKDFDLAAAWGGGGGSNPAVSYSYYDDFVISTSIPSKGASVETKVPFSPTNLTIK